jgi:uncharacterized protein (DUF1800 family)
MDRRKFLKNLSNTIATNNNGKGRPIILSGLEPYTGTWNEQTAAQLLYRAGVGTTKSQISQFTAMTLDDAVSSVLAIQKTPNPPVDPTTNQTWHDKPYNGTNNSKYVRYLKAWFMSLLINSSGTAHERMTLFWQNHFVSEAATVTDARYMYKQNALLRQYALGNIKQFVIEITKDPAMLKYLNGNTNTVGSPNENYGREVQELFTIGKGPETTPSNYTYYTEDDVKAAARVLTGWRDVSADVSTKFVASSHDTKDKVFSADYNNTVIKGRSGNTAGDDELKDFVDMLFSQDETARFLCRKLYRWFVYYEIDDTIETNVIEPLADVMRSNNYEVLPVLNTLFKSAAFYDFANMGVMIKNPVDFFAWAIKEFNLPVPDINSNLAGYYNLFDKIAQYCATLEMNLMDQPNVAGWPQYYQVPGFYRLWLNTATLPQRNGFTDSIIYGGSYFGKNFVFDSVDYVDKNISNPADVTAMLDELTQLLFDNDLTAQQKDYLKSTVLLDGLPDYEWASEWTNYKSNPNDKQAKSTVKTRLDVLFRFMLRMAEYQLM